MREELLEKLREISPEESRILMETGEVDRDIYTSDTDFTIDSRKMLSDGQLIAARTHTRFVHFPLHRHNYVEVQYVCQGSLTNIIDGKSLTVGAGELLFLNQYTRHELLPAGRDDIAINLLILPEFFDAIYPMTGSENVLADFLFNVLRGDFEKGEFLHFKVSEVLQIQNLIENLVYSLVTGLGNSSQINQGTMGLIFLHLLDYLQYMETGTPDRYENMILSTTIAYIDAHYPDATLTELCVSLHQPMSALSRMIKQGTGHNFKELLQRKRLSRAVELMCETDLPIAEIIAAVGYENSSYFHRVFRQRYEMTPLAFRKQNRSRELIRL